MPRRNDSWRAGVKRYRCGQCGKPCSTPAGRNRHYRICHTDNPKAERNWNICMMYFQEQQSRREIAETYNLSIGTVSRVVGNAIQYPYFYELDAALLAEPNIIPINRKVS